MYIDRIIYPIYTLGPGKRIVIWFAGCSKKCKGCSNPELWEKNQKYKISVENVKKIIHKLINQNQVDGITLTGGDPLEQSTEEMAELLKEFNEFDILLYTGYEYNQIEKKEILKFVDVLIDGRYVEELNNNKVELRGSINQKIIYINKNKKEVYEKYMKENGRKIQNLYYQEKLISVGIPNKLEEMKNNV